MTNKLYDAVIIASDKHGNNKLRYCNNLNKRLEVLKRDKFTVHDTILLPQFMTKEQIINYLLERQIDRLCDDDRNAVINASKVVKRKNVRKTTVQDVTNIFVAQNNENLENM